MLSLLGICQGHISHSRFTFRFWKIFHTDFPRCNPTKGECGSLFSSHIIQQVLLTVLLIFSISTKVRWDLKIVLTCISIISRDDEQFFSYFFSHFFFWIVHRSNFEKKDCLFFLSLCFLGYLHVLILINCHICSDSFIFVTDAERGSNLSIWTFLSFSLWVFL